MKKNKVTVYVGSLAVGVVLGLLMKNLAIGLSLGVVLGIAYASRLDK